MGLAGTLGGNHFLECSVVTVRRRSTLWSAVVAAGARGIGVLLPALALQGCFDVHQFDPGNGRFVIDDFEDGDTLPKATPLFKQWTCFTFNPNIGQDPAQSVNCGLETPGDASGYALFASFTLHDPPDSNLQYPGAALATSTYPMVDFNGYHNLVFSLRVDRGNLPSAAFAHVVLDCNSVIAESPKKPGENFAVDQQIVATDTWKTFTLELSKFTQPLWQLNRFASGIQTCLAVIDDVNFQVSGQLADGQSAYGVIHIDDIYLE
jgi:hypothetical protein